LSFDLRHQVEHVVAESARHAAITARHYGSEALGQRIDAYRADLADPLGKVLGKVKSEAKRLVVRARRCARLVWRRAP
jgi:hypothetical protein